QKLAAGVPYVIRQKIPEEGVTSFDDVVYGHISIENHELDEGVLLKSDGLPTYNFANVVDDHLMGITHIIRGSEYLTSTPKYNLLYQAFGWDIPTYIHVAPIVKEGGAKYSKRNGDASYEDFLNMGYLKEAVINYIALLGWNPGTEQEIFTMDGLIEAFGIQGISKSPAVFDIKKLNWMNGEYLRAKTPEEFYELALPYLKKAITSPQVNLRLLSDLLQKRCEKLSDIPETVDFIDQMGEHDETLYISKKMKTNPQISLEMLQKTKEVLEGLSDWTEEEIHQALSQLIERLGVKNGVVLFPLRAAVSGKTVTPGGGVELAVILGREETLRRISGEISFLQGVV
ncbi:MAG: glutamate--tRNA ligase, partial [Clostridia bacterium]|nr:glutamate--tRNA ligase [Clostridia bacterium]